MGAVIHLQLLHRKEVTAVPELQVVHMLAVAVEGRQERVVTQVQLAVAEERELLLPYLVTRLLMQEVVEGVAKRQLLVLGVQVGVVLEGKTQRERLAVQILAAVGVVLGVYQHQ